MKFTDAVKVTYVVIMEDHEFLVDVWWSINLPNNPSMDELLELFVIDYYGKVPYNYFQLNELRKYETGALEYLYSDN